LAENRRAESLCRLESHRIYQSRAGPIFLDRILYAEWRKVIRAALDLASADFRTREVASAAAAVNGLASLDELRSLRSLRR
jgi:hypothetical protein